ncbi:hypothetical protein NIES2135_63250 (plasmid) [Leptolyngbya boryana NIES-2135]|uniref:Uncharacterized protein n=1 Tax=Leptolyngbya boryana NIES-2135 TaxID=1973484 RepID=A0A1Z4JS07_LEPBY|nr:hypothetical protein NIES2135_63250 [Leptolyngbya boryana NIES-2135]
MWTKLILGIVAASFGVLLGVAVVNIIDPQPPKRVNSHPDPYTHNGRYLR